MTVLRKYFSDQTKRTQQITAVIVVVLVAAIGTYLVTGSHAAAPYVSTTADSGTLGSGAITQPCSGASDGSCVVFGASSDQGAINKVLLTSADAQPYYQNVSDQPFFQQFYRGYVFVPYWANIGAAAWFHQTWIYDDAYDIVASGALGNPGSESPSTAWIIANYPSWILRDKSGNPLYINYGCNQAGGPEGEYCPQFAADIGNSQYWNYWLTGCAVGNDSIPADANNPKICNPNFVGGLEGTMKLGYEGVYIDDVNMNYDASEGNGTSTLPDGQTPVAIDPRTGTNMTPLAWSQYMADFMVAVRQALPNVEIVHNAVWYEGGDTGTTFCVVDPSGCWTGTPDPTDIAKEVESANWIVKEGGLVDGGLLGLTAPSGNPNPDERFQLLTLLQYASYVHTLPAMDELSNGTYGPTGKNVNFFYQSYATDRSSDGLPSYANADDIEYNVAGYLLTSNGQDGVSNGADFELPPGTPSTLPNGAAGGPLWPGYNRDLGTASGAYTIVNDSYFQRTFSNGLVFLNPPSVTGSNTPLTISLPAGTYIDYSPSGTKQTYSGSITLNSSSGAVLSKE